eukprot:3751262-Alexandrium_andersonii.AAC.1
MLLEGQQAEVIREDPRNSTLHLDQPHPGREDQGQHGVGPRVALRDGPSLAVRAAAAPAQPVVEQHGLLHGG